MVGNLHAEYLHKIQHTYEQEIIDNSRDSREVSNATKRKDKIQTDRDGKKLDILAKIYLYKPPANSTNFKEER